LKTIHSGRQPASHKRGRGAPKGNRNALKHGRDTGERRAIRRLVAGRLRSVRAALKAAEQLRAQFGRR